MLKKLALSLFKNDQRREIRENPEKGLVIIHGTSYPLKDWSAGGFSISGFHSNVEDIADEDGRVDIELQAEIMAEVFILNCKAIITRALPDTGFLSGAFIEVPTEERLVLEEYFDQLEKRKSR